MRLRHLILFFILFIQPVFAHDSAQGIPSLAPMLEKVTPAVVNIYTINQVRQNNSSLFEDRFLKEFFNSPGSKANKKNRAGLGSGVIIDSSKGLIITNNHVIAKATDIKVKLMDGREFKAEIVGTDPATDIAIIKINAKKLKSLKIANSNDLRVGDFVVAIGNPFGIGQTVTSGIISALGRSGLGIEAYEDFIQTDASINPGNSGGALVNLRGELIGINTAIIGSGGRNPGSIGIGLAIPTNLAINISEQILKFGKVKRGILGVSAQDLTPNLAKAFGLTVRSGVLITEIRKNSSASKAGLKTGDVITAVDGKKVNKANDLRNIIGLTPVGQSLKFTVLRNKKTEFVKIEISENEELANLKINPRLEGISFKEIKKGMREYGIIEGLIVSTINKNSIAFRNGIRKNDIILSINNIAVKSIKDVHELSRKNKDQIVLNVRRGNRSAFILLR
ncbi:MAG: DegQ family serine endoprotease [Pseudomonadota bacterium]|nr:DegQ family serine endoprotease [Pseudomonadota bacterium]MEC9190536.1 DegQ family serine endoprotease [Pseudomonadota bacterium]